MAKRLGAVETLGQPFRQGDLLALVERIRFLTEDEEKNLLNASSEPLRTILLVGIYAGLRIQAEALTLKWRTSIWNGRP